MNKKKLSKFYSSSNIINYLKYLPGVIILIVGMYIATFVQDGYFTSSPIFIIGAILLVISSIFNVRSRDVKEYSDNMIKEEEDRLKEKLNIDSSIQTTKNDDLSLISSQYVVLENSRCKKINDSIISTDAQINCIQVFTKEKKLKAEIIKIDILNENAENIIVDTSFSNISDFTFNEYSIKKFGVEIKCLVVSFKCNLTEYKLYFNNDYYLSEAFNKLSGQLNQSYNKP